ncbi:PhoH family protein [Jiulongibacter sediminis]|uniref:Phosphate starvation protein PhoH n=1 Tax=Jiulongibacter sediminis TaxID=1605367 RepID=A0A0P7BL37_9BACT|nr:PhoH family protein [Jiulongibacter sediminis]KPM47977.1 phosphate starvation protein PhoH [Jiulongibacter sediminis]TBX24159.1 phosphate starvation protein PhoH [Jiulongibacter sediminis]
MTKKRAKGKLFVLDTSVLLFDHNSIQNFEENDVAIPITVLEELDNFKIGNDTKNFEARAVIRFLDKLSGVGGLDNWIKITPKKGRVKIVMATDGLEKDATKIYGSDKNDHKIINSALSLQQEFGEKNVTLVTKDINLRIKAKAIGLNAEDYLTGKVKDMDTVSEGASSFNQLDSEIIHELYAKGRIQENGILNGSKVANGYYVLNNCSESVLARYDAVDDMLERVEKAYAYGVKPKNAEQTFALDALMNDEIKLVAVQGVAGTGKTLLALAAALEQKNKYDQIILARPIIPLSNREIGFLPGGAEEKISPYMQPLFDNLKFIKSQFKGTEKRAKVLEELEESGKLTITALAFIRGRSFANVMFIVDEAQNLTPHEVKTIITRAGEGTKIVFTGDIAQIDTPYMDEQSNGLTYLIDKLKGHPLFAHIKLEKGERSELANLANEML